MLGCQIQMLLFSEANPALLILHIGHFISLATIKLFDCILARANAKRNKLRVKISTPSEGTEKSGFYN